MLDIKTYLKKKPAKEKIKPFFVHINNELYLDANKIAKKNNLTMRDIIEACLKWFIDQEKK